MKPPTKYTLQKYGLSLEEWVSLYEKQGKVCAICKRKPNGRICVDHEHFKGWKQMTPDKRKQFVRGLLCWGCNHTLVRGGVTAEKLRAAATYLEKHDGKMLWT